MASISTDKQGYNRVQFNDPVTGKRKAVYLGKISLASAEKIKTHVEALIGHRREDAPHDAALIRWVASLPDELAGKLASAGLIEPRQNTKELSPTLAEYIGLYLDSKPHIKKSTRITSATALNSAITVLGRNRRISEIDEPIAGTLIRGMMEGGYSKAYISKAVTIMKGMFRTAIREKRIGHNPFEFLKAGSQVNNARKQFIPPEIIYKLMEALPGKEWPLLVVLARWGGLRTPSEPFALRWDHVLWDQGRLIVPTPKLEHYPGRETRVMPIFPEVRPYLDAAWDAADEGELYLFPHLRSMSGNVSTQLKKYILRAGLTPWPRTWQNLRASRATELADRFPGHVAAAWLGHTNEIADRHYRSVLDSHFEEATQPAKIHQQPLMKATQIPTQYDAERDGHRLTEVQIRNAEKRGDNRVFWRNR